VFLSEGIVWGRTEGGKSAIRGKTLKGRAEVVKKRPIPQKGDEIGMEGFMEGKRSTSATWTGSIAMPVQGGTTRFVQDRGGGGGFFCGGFFVKRKKNCPPCSRKNPNDEGAPKKRKKGLLQTQRGGQVQTDEKKESNTTDHQESRLRS